MPDQAINWSKLSWTVPTESKEVRLDLFARRCLPHLSRRSLEQAIRDKLFRINGKIAKKGAKLPPGAVLSFSGPDFWLVTGPAALSLAVPIVYEDSSLLVVNKPAGMATHGFSGRETKSLANCLIAARPELYHVGKSRWEPGLVHRLDRETSGLVMVAKTQDAFERLRNQFRRREIEKTYLALVWGKTKAAGTVSFPLAHDLGDKRRMRALFQASVLTQGERCWQAVTHFRKLTQAKGLSLLEIEMKTGVTHQIRVHLAAIGHPIVGDELYGAPDAETFWLQRHFLHACRLKFCHPESKEIVSVEAALPGELQMVLDEIQN
jgi:23S rRNA pseudouridine1911/1915/1917 synthase